MPEVRFGAHLLFDFDVKLNKHTKQLLVIAFGVSVRESF